MPETQFRVLVIRLSSLGDIVHALPAVAALGETFPDTEIHWAVEARHAGLLSGNPYVRRIVPLDTLGWRQRLGSAATWENVARAMMGLRDMPYDVALDFQGLWKSAAIGWLSRARERWGFAEGWLREPAAGVLYTERFSPGEGKHVIEINMALVERLGARAKSWRFPLPRTDEDDEDVVRRLAALCAGDFIIINPGGGWLSKCWAPENYAALIRRLASERRENILLTGSTAEEGLIQGILAAAGTSRGSYFPSTVIQYIALARRARLFIGGDTGPLHLAAAVGTPIVAIYGPTSPERNGPFSRADIVLWNRGLVNHTRRGKAPAYLPGIRVESVLAAVRERLAGTHE